MTTFAIALGGGLLWALIFDRLAKKRRAYNFPLGLLALISILIACITTIRMLD